MDKLIKDHIFYRVTTKTLVEANTRYREGNKTALDEVTAHRKTLVEFRRVLSNTY